VGCAMASTVAMCVAACEGRSNGFGLSSIKKGTCDVDLASESTPRLNHVICKMLRLIDKDDKEVHGR